MKALTTKLLSIILVLSMVFGLSVPAIAAEYDNAYASPVESDEYIQSARNVYYSLNSEARVIFERALANDVELLEFHRLYVNPTYSALARAYSITVTAAADPMTILSAQLAALSLPTAVAYSLNAMGAAMVAAILDGPLPIGDILLAAATATTVVIVATHWKTVSPKWSQIVSAFQKAFSDSVSNVLNAFNILKSDINTEVIAQFNKSAEDAINGADTNKQNHILNNNLHPRKWNLLFNGKDPKWSQLVPILIKALKEGKETIFNSSQNVYERAIPYGGYEVVVRFIKTAEGFVGGLSTAYLR